MSKLSNNITSINEIKQILQTKALPSLEKDVYEGEYDGSGKISHSKLYRNTRVIGQILGIIKSAKGSEYGYYDGSFDGDGDVVNEGYTVSFQHNSLSSSGQIFYSLDNGNSWVDIYTWTNPLENINQIKFKTVGSIKHNATIMSDILGFHMLARLSSETENYILSFDVDDISITDSVDPA